ncbi:MAG: hypothetical protein KGL36_09655 [Gammaproteobacteria bacterium]|nr:hypothetical protein [Gammaproteobacteria bacterium]
MRRSEEIRIDRDAARADRDLRALPLRSAPPGFEDRVFAELRRRAALPWWRRSFAKWPPLPRAGLIVVCAASTLGAWRLASGIASVAGVVLQRVAGPFLMLRELLRALLAADSSLRLIGGGVGPQWLQGGAVVAAVAYVALIGLGATAYRTLYLES